MNASHLLCQSAWSRSLLQSVATALVGGKRDAHQRDSDSGQQGDVSCVGGERGRGRGRGGGGGGARRAPRGHAARAPYD